MTIKYRVNYYESECGWGSDSWNTDYATEQEAKEAYEECYDRYMRFDLAPSYYIRPTYIGEVTIK